MLRKLMKHELFATGRLMLPLLLLALVSALGAGYASGTLLEGDNRFANVIGVLIMIVFVLSMLAMCFVAFYLMLQRFYSNLLTDEGYLMMTLPVSVHQQIWAKLLVSLIWFVVSAITVAASVLLLVMGDTGSLQELFQAMGILWEELRGSGYLSSAILIAEEFVILALLGGMASCLHFYAAMAVGQSFAGHKLLWSVLMFFAMSFALQLLGGIGIRILAPIFLESNPFTHAEIIAGAQWTLLGGIGITLVQGGLFYGITAWFLKNRLNLS